MPILTTRRGRGMRGYLPGSSPVPVYRFIPGAGVLPLPKGCGCHRRKHLGDDSSDDFNFGFPTGLIAPGAGGDIANVPSVANYPASPSSGLDYIPGISGNPTPMPPTTQAYQVSSSGVIPVLNNPSLSYLTTGAAVPTTALSAALGGSTIWWLLGGAALVGAVALMGKRR
jgi:hypothetical protein